MTEDIKQRLANKAKAEEQQAVEKEQQLVNDAQKASVNIYNMPGKVVLAVEYSSAHLRASFAPAKAISREKLSMW